MHIRECFQLDDDNINIDIGIHPSPSHKNDDTVLVEGDMARYPLFGDYKTPPPLQRQTLPQKTYQVLRYTDTDLVRIAKLCYFISLYNFLDVYLETYGAALVSPFRFLRKTEGFGQSHQYG